MEIKRNFEMLVVTNRRYTIRQASPDRQSKACTVCGEPMLTAEQAAKIFGIKQRRIFQIIETEAAHFTEIEAGAVAICLTSLAIVLDGEAQVKTKFTA